MHADWSIGTGVAIVKQISPLMCIAMYVGKGYRPPKISMN